METTQNTPDKFEPSLQKLGFDLLNYTTVEFIDDYNSLNSYEYGNIAKLGLFTLAMFRSEQLDKYPILTQYFIFYCIKEGLVIDFNDTNFNDYLIKKDIITQRIEKYLTIDTPPTPLSAIDIDYIGFYDDMRTILMKELSYCCKDQTVQNFKILGNILMGINNSLTSGTHIDDVFDENLEPKDKYETLVLISDDYMSDTPYICDNLIIMTSVQQSILQFETSNLYLLEADFNFDIVISDYTLHTTVDVLSSLREKFKALPITSLKVYATYEDIVLGLRSSEIDSIDNVINDNSTLQYVDLSSLALRMIGNNVLTGCPMVSNLVLPKNLVSIGDNFCLGAKMLKYLPTQELENLQYIGDNFLAHSGVTWQKLKNVKEIGNFFMAHTPISVLNLSKCSNLEHIGNNFADSCANLTSVFLENLTKLESIGDNFLLNPPKTQLDIRLSGLTALSILGDNFLANVRTPSVNLLSSTMLRTIGRNFLANAIVEEVLVAYEENLYKNKYFRNMEIPSNVSVLLNDGLNCIAYVNTTWYLFTVNWYSTVTPLKEVDTEFLYQVVTPVQKYADFDVITNRSPLIKVIGDEEPSFQITTDTTNRWICDKYTD